MQERKPFLKRIIERIIRKKPKQDILPTEEPALPAKSPEQLKDELLRAEVGDNNAEIERLIKAGADITVKGYDNWTALGLVAAKGNTKACDLLIQKHKECNGDIKKLITATNKYNMTVLQWAAWNSRTETCKLLLEEYAKAGGDIKELITTDAALHCAASLGGNQTCIFLIQEYAKAGGDIKKLIAAKDTDGQTALDKAAIGKHMKTVQFLKFMEWLAGVTGNAFMKSFADCLAA